MFEKIFLEKDLTTNKYAKSILERLKKVPVLIDTYEDVFQRVKKPYLQKRESLNLFIARKKGDLVKIAPDAYGLSGEPHYYFINAYNCIYECNYCYLQGYFNSPDLVIFVNHEEICADIQTKIDSHLENSDVGIWFHAGEFSDSLALSHITGEIPRYFELFKKNPRAFLELRTKSVNTKTLESLNPLPNVICSFSLSPAKKIKDNDLKTPPLKSRLAAIKKIHKIGHPIAIHLDPIIYSEGIVDDYNNLLSQLNEIIPLRDIEYISVGVVRFTKDVFRQVKQNYPDSEYFYSEMITGHDSKVKYPRPMRHWLLQKIKSLCLKHGATEKSVYLCMED